MKHYVISGTSGAGKSTLVNKFRDKFEVYSEFIEGSNEIYKNYQKSINDDQDAKNNFIYLNMIDKYKKTIESANTILFDRNIFDYYVASELRIKDKNLEFHNKLVKEFDAEIRGIKERGIELEYIILSTSWSEFKNRILLRGREHETSNIKANDSWYKKYHSNYNGALIAILKMHHITYRVIDTTDLSEEDTFNLVKNIIG